MSSWKVLKELINPKVKRDNNVHSSISLYTRNIGFYIVQKVNKFNEGHLIYSSYLFSQYRECSWRCYEPRGIQTLTH